METTPHAGNSRDQNSLGSNFLKGSELVENFFPIGVVASKTSSRDHIPREAYHVLVYFHVCNSTLGLDPTLPRFQHGVCGLHNHVHHTLQQFQKTKPCQLIAQRTALLSNFEEKWWEEENKWSQTTKFHLHLPPSNHFQLLLEW